ncbi:MAG: methionyl-tRNA formyltransferase [Chthonomonadaceae bacterium]|nr:methionyl-tRNA formyltransferase [Chthonomonadaceae bacterium]
MPNPPQPSLVFFGTADFAVPSLTALVEAGYRVLAVVTQPDKPSGRGQTLVSSPVKKAAERLELPLLQPRRVKSEKFFPKLAPLAPDFLVVAAFGQIIPQTLLDLPRFAPINVHGSLLPKLRGAAPIQRAIMEGHSEAGVATMWMEDTIDTGDILLMRSLPIEPEDTTGTLFPKLATLGAELLLETLSGMVAGTMTRTPQNNAEATFATMIRPEDALIRWDETAFATNCRIRGVLPKPGATSEIGGKRLKIHLTTPLEETTDAEPGTVLALDKTTGGIKVACGEKTVLLLREVQPDNGKRMTALSWANGARIQAGMRFS